jgi:hypothetical protein
MRQESPTGGALGSITERELAFLQAVQGSLDQGQTPSQLLENLKFIRENLQDVFSLMERLREGEGRQQTGSAQQNAEPPLEQPRQNADPPPPPGFQVVEPTRRNIVPPPPPGFRVLH